MKQVKKKDSERANATVRPNGITTALWQRCRRVTWRIKWLSDPCQNRALTPARPVAPTTLPCHSRHISAIHTLIHKDNKAVWPTRTAFWSTEMHHSSKSQRKFRWTVCLNFGFISCHASVALECSLMPANNSTMRCTSNFTRYRKWHGKKWLVSWSVVLTVCLRGELHAAQQ